MALAGYDFNVEMLVTQDDDEPRSWTLPDLEWRVLYLITMPSGKKYKYATYIDFGTSTWKEGLSLYNDGDISETTWNFAASGWTPEELVQPDIADYEGESLDHSFRWSRGTDLLTTSVTVADKKEFTQVTTVMIDGEDYTFTAVQFFDGDKFRVKASFDTCSFDFTKGNSDETWYDCDTVTGYKNTVKIMVTNSFDADNTWIIPNAEWRIRYAINEMNMEYATVVDFESSTWKEGLWLDDEYLSETTWNFAAVGWEAEPNLSLPDIYDLDHSTGEHTYKWAKDGDLDEELNDVTTYTYIDDSKIKFVQKVNVKVAGVDY